jgi:hypothetical protein
MPTLRWGVAGVVLALLPAVGLLPQVGAPAAEESTLPPELDLIPRDAAAVLSVRLADFWKSDQARDLRELMAGPGGGLREAEGKTGLRVADVQRLTVLVPSIDHSGPTPPVVFVTTGQPYDRGRVLKALQAQSPGANHLRRIQLPGRPRAEAVEEKPDPNAPYYVFGRDEGVVYLRDDRNLVLAFRNDPGGADPALGLLGQLLRRAPRGSLGDALARAGSRHTAVACVSVADVVRALPEKLPLELHPFLPLLKAEAATATLDVADTTRLNIRLQFASAEAARKAAPRAQTLITLGGELLAGVRKELARDAEEQRHLLALIDQAEAALKDTVVHTRGDRLEVDGAVKTQAVLAPALAEVAARIRGVGARTQSLNNLRQMALAFHNYHATFTTFPPAALCDAAGKPLLSWRVAILPFVEEQELYKQFKLDEPWDSEHNKKLLDKMPKIYALPGARIKEPGRTVYQLFVGKDALFEGGKKPRITDVLDGTSNTLLIVEAAEPVPWTKPADIPLGARDPRSQVGGWFGDIVNVALCDGSVRTIHRKKMSEKTFRHAIMPADGNALGPDW